MKLALINCPACSSPIEKDLIRPNQPFNCPACNSAVVLTDWTTNGQLVCSTCGTVSVGLAPLQASNDSYRQQHGRGAQTHPKGRVLVERLKSREVSQA